MKSMLLNLWAWVLVHPEAIATAALAVLSVIAATIANARAKGAPVSWFERFVDRVSVRTRANAANAGWSWPIVGRSIFEAALDASAPPPKDPPSPPSEPGYIDRAVLWIVGGVALLALGAMLLGGCAAASNPMLSPIAPRIIQRAEYGTCIESGGKLEVPNGPTFAMITQACMLMDAGAAVVADASAPVEETDAAIVPDAIKPGSVALVLPDYLRGMCTVPVFVQGAKTLADLDPVRCAVTAPGDRITVFRRGQRWVTLR